MKPKKIKLKAIDKFDLFIEKLTKILIIAIMITIPSIQFIRMYSLFFEDTVKIYDNLNVSCIVYISLPILLAIYIYKIVRKTYKIGIKDIILYLLAVLAIISTVCAIDVKTSLFGLGERFEGLFTILFYYLLILVSASVKDWRFNRTFINIFIWIGIVQAVYAFCQVIVRPIWALGFVLPYMANAFFGNPNFLGAFMAMCLLLSIGSYLFLDKNKKFYFASSILFSIGIILANSFGPLVGILVAFAVLFFVVLVKYKALLKKCILIILMSGMTIFIGAYAIDNYCTNKFQYTTMPGYTLRSDFDEILGVIFKSNQEKNTEPHTVEENTSPISMINGRSKVWERSLELVKEHFWFGAGLDNFATIYQEKYGEYIDKAHNIYLNILVTNGIFALVGYVGMIVYILIRAFRNLDEIGMIFILAFICYIALAFFNINVLIVVPYFYIIAGLSLGNCDINKLKAKKK